MGVEWAGPLCSRRSCPERAGRAPQDVSHADPRGEEDGAVRHRRALLAVAITVLLVASAAAAGPEPELEDLPRGFGYLSAFFVTSIDLRLNVFPGDVPLGARIDTNKDLGLAGSFTIPRLELGYRFGKRHLLLGSYYDLTRSGTETLERTLQIGDTAFPIQASVDTRITMKVYRLSYVYLFHADPKVSLGVNMGLFTSVLGADLEGVVDGLTLNENRDFNKSVTAPLPVLGFRITYRASRKLSLLATADWFFLRYSGYGGLLTDTQVYIAHRTFRHVGFVAGLNLQRLSGEYDDKNGYQWELESGLIGFNVGLAFYF